MVGMQIALVGGDGREQRRFPQGVHLQRIAAPRYSGNGRWKSFLRSLGRGQVDQVVLLTRWIGHSAAAALKQAAARAGVPVHEIRGSVSMAERMVEALADGRDPCPLGASERRRARARSLGSASGRAGLCPSSSR